MTAPLTPPPHQPPNGNGPGSPWQAPDPMAGHVPPPGPGYAPAREEGPGLRAEIREALLVFIGVAVLGLALGGLWLWLAPRVPLVSDSTAVYLKDTEGEQAIGIDGTFALLGLAFGAVTALLVFLWRRRGGIGIVVALALGALLGGVVAWRFGIWLGPAQDVAAHAKEVGKGVVFDAPLELKAKGALLAWPLAAMVVHLGLTGLFGPRDPDPYAQYYPQGLPAAPSGPAAPSAPRGPGA
ncbi:DUF2567 domain-containing protein [Streptomyces sp. VRA16 Mangrove soil]|uniref:DUF2567 domain-containing protein n=1 Tax=Streptomyces sp. VRA16 Mangrove soil TaxID=2817434 RepID=UPI001A9E8287|nr:DUF2567 domain-containing protein [Streptomyces sp. VRA16 Mangrove soil]MBO1333442.1 DUF2567 domain-containing protein [Streptomyces sp. VRA16 Mangrove soil]